MALFFKDSRTTSRGTCKRRTNIGPLISYETSVSISVRYFLCNHDPTMTTIYCGFMNRILVLFAIFERQFPNSFFRAQMISCTSPIDIHWSSSKLADTSKIPCVLPLCFQLGLRGLSSRIDLTRTSLFSHPLVVDHEKRQ